jgi:hypothetical protein
LDYAGIGINLQNTSNQLVAEKNTIGLLTNDVSVLVCGGATPLNGIAASYINGSTLKDNFVNGNSNSSLLIPAREDIAGIQISNSKNQTMSCNTIQKTRFGILAISENPTSPTAVSGNHLSNHVMGWVFRHLGSDGTFGDVGDNNNDNNNTFGGSGYVKQVFRFCINPIPVNNAEKIYTNSTTLSSSNSSSFCDATQGAQCSYDVGNPTGSVVTTFNCPSISTGTLVAVDPNYIDLEEAVMIALDTKIYREYEEISRWIDRKKLYDFLVNNPAIRNGNSTFLTFFNTMQSDALHQIIDADIKLTDLLNAYATNNATLIAQRLASVNNSNNNIDDTRIQEKNEQLINEKYNFFYF